MEAFEHFGLWWLPDDDSRTVGGIIRFDPSNGITLRVAGLIDGLEPFSMSEMIPIILGRTENGKTITLYQCENVSIRDGIGINARTYRARAAFVGAWFETEDDIRFSSGTVQFSSLPDWVGGRAFQVESTHPPDAWSYTIRWDQPAELISNTRIGVIRLGHGHGVKTERNRSMSITQMPAFVIEVSETFTIHDWLQSVVYPLQVFLTLAMRKPASVSNMTVHADVQSSNGEVERPVAVQVVYEPAFHDTSQSGPIFRDTMLFSLEDIRDDFDTVMAHWFARVNDLREVVSHFYSIKFRSSTYLETRFLIVVQAVEAYHRRSGRRERAIPDDEYQELLTEILAGTPEDHREWLQQKLRYGYEPSLAQRLKDLIEDTQPTIEPLLINSNKFARTVVDTRNYLTHYSKELQTRAATGPRLHWITSALTDLFEACLLNDLGFTPQQARELFAKNRRYQHASQNPV